MEEKMTAKKYRETNFKFKEDPNFPGLQQAMFDSKLKEYAELIATEQRHNCADEYTRFLGRQSETDAVTNILGAKKPEF